MAFIVIEIDVPGLSIGTLNSQVQRPTKPHDAVNGLNNLLSGILNGSYDASVQVTTRDVTASVTTSGSGSEQELYDLK